MHQLECPRCGDRAVPRARTFNMRACILSRRPAHPRGVVADNRRGPASCLPAPPLDVEANECDRPPARLCRVPRAWCPNVAPPPPPSSWLERVMVGPLPPTGAVPADAPSTANASSSSSSSALCACALDDDTDTSPLERGVAVAALAAVVLVAVLVSCENEWGAAAAPSERGTLPRRARRSTSWPAVARLSGFTWRSTCNRRRRPRASVRGVAACQ